MLLLDPGTIVIHASTNQWTGIYDRDLSHERVKPVSMTLSKDKIQRATFPKCSDFYISVT